MSRDNETPPKKESPEQRHKEFLQRHNARMERVDKTLTTVRKANPARRGTTRDGQAGA